MRFIYIFACSAFLFSHCFAEAEGPVVLGNHGNQDAASITDDTYFPPATEPYKPMESGNPQPAKSDNIESSYTNADPIVSQTNNNSLDSPMKITYSVPSPAPAPQQMIIPQQTQQPANSAVGAYPFPANRELIEQAADKCDEEVAQIWSQRSNIDSYRLPHFQKCMGQAKVRCDKLKELAKSIKQADEHLYSYQREIQDAQKDFQ